MRHYAAPRYAVSTPRIPKDVHVSASEPTAHPSRQKPLGYALGFLIVGIVLVLWGRAGAAIAQTTVCPGQEGEAAIQCIQTQYSPTATLGYENARELMYLELDADASGQVTGIYSGYTVTVTDTDDPIGDAFDQDINAEHLYPQSKGAGSEPQKSDLHGLRPARVQVNSARGNVPFAPVPTDAADQWYRNDTSQQAAPPEPTLWSQRRSDTAWEPRAARKGDVARAVLYFYAIYRADLDSVDDTYFETMRETLLTWNDLDPADAAEDARMQAVAEAQGNENPFVLDPTLAQRTFAPNEETTPTLAFELGPVVPDDASETELVVRYDSPNGSATTVDVTFDSQGSTLSAADLGGFDTQTVSFEPDATNGQTQTVTVPITGEATTGSEDIGRFVLENPESNGPVSIGTPVSTTLTLVDVDPPLVLNEVLYDPPPGADGDANGDGVRDAFDDEFVEVYNTSSSIPLDLSGYVYFDEDVFETGRVRHTMPEGTVVEPGESIVVFGGGTPSSDIPGVVQTASSGRLSLANAGDSFTLRNAYDMEITTFTHTGTTDNESMTRDPEFTGDFVAHSTISSELFSPGRQADGDPLPVELAEFEAQRADRRRASEEAVVLQWRTLSETNNAGFDIQRRAGSAPESTRESWQSIATIGGAGTTDQPQSYRFEDTALPFAADSLAYRLRQIDTDGSTSLSEAVVLARPAVAARLLRPYPNPTRSAATVPFALPKRQAVRITLYDIMGRRVRTLVEGERSGRHEIPLNVSQLASGMYVIRMQTGGMTDTQRITVVR